MPSRRTSARCSRCRTNCSTTGARNGNARPTALGWPRSTPRFWTSSSGPTQSHRISRPPPVRQRARSVDALDIVLLILAIALIPVAGLFAAADAAITMVSAARVEELQREGGRGAAPRYAVVGDKPRYTNLLLLLRVGAELTATVLVTAVALSTWGFNVWVGLVVVLVMLLSSYVAIGVLPRTIGRQHPYAVGLIA